MSENVQLALIAALPAILTALAALIVAFRNALAIERHETLCREIPRLLHEARVYNGKANGAAPPPAAPPPPAAAPPPAAPPAAPPPAAPPAAPPPAQISQGRHLGR